MILPGLYKCAFVSVEAAVRLGGRNRVDAVLGSQVLRHILRLHLRYFEHRPTGVLIARVHAVETIREFMSGAAVSLVLDFPFLLVFVAVMFAYSWQPTGYNTVIGEHGVGLSGGQKQRLAIARPVLKRPKILIFDEATSALDAHTAERFAQTVNKLKGAATILFIAHQLPKGLAVDEVFTLAGERASQMRVVEEGEA